MNERLILLVEDNPDDEELTQLAFEEAGVDHTLVVARDGAEALDYLFATGPHAGRDTARQPTVVLLDLKLPKIDGLEVLRRLRDDPRTNLVPVVVLSTSRERQDISTSYRLRVNSYVRKPVNFDEFTEVMRHLGRYWLTINLGPGSAEGSS